MALCGVLSAACVGDLEDFGTGSGGGGDDDGTQVGDDDDSDDGLSDPFNGDWFAYGLEIGIVTEGGEEGGDAIVHLSQSFHDESLEFICGNQYSFYADYTYGTSQGSDFYSHIDEVLTFTDVLLDASDCPEDWDVGLEHLVDWWRWRIHPLAFISCDQVAGDDSMAQSHLGEDLIWDVEGDGTFRYYCESIGPVVEYYGHLGRTEGIWLIPGGEGDMILWGDFAYLYPPLSGNVEVWMLTGLALADLGNENEPTIGLDGSYALVPLFEWWYMN